MKCTRPIKLSSKKNGVRYDWEVPCNRCISCRKTKISEWTARIKAEISTKEIPSHFITLTYSDESLPFSENISTLLKKDLQNFNKRLRKKNKDYIKYFCCGEYGENTLRPHYHGIYINLNLTRTELVKCWGMGDVHVGTVTDSSIKYVVSYCINKSKKEDYLPAEQPFQINSNNIGIDWLKKNLEQVSKDGYLKYNGNKIPIPKTWKDKFPEVKKGSINARLKNIKKYKNWKDVTENWHTEGLKNEIETREQRELKEELTAKRKNQKNKI